MEYGLKFHGLAERTEKRVSLWISVRTVICWNVGAKGRNVLNMFCYTGGSLFHAMRGGESGASGRQFGKAIDLTNMNVELNFPAIPVKAYAEDVLNTWIVWEINMI